MGRSRRSMSVCARRSKHFSKPSLRYATVIPRPPNRLLLPAQDHEQVKTQHDLPPVPGRKQLQVPDPHLDHAVTLDQPPLSNHKDDLPHPPPRVLTRNLLKPHIVSPAPLHQTSLGIYENDLTLLPGNVIPEKTVPPLTKKPLLTKKPKDRHVRQRRFKNIVSG